MTKYIKYKKVVDYMDNGWRMTVGVGSSMGSGNMQDMCIG